MTALRSGSLMVPVLPPRMSSPVRRNGTANCEVHPSPDISRGCVVVPATNKQTKEITMEPRLDVLSNDTAMKAVKYLASAGRAAAGSLPMATQELVKIRASQINGCGFC